MAINTRAWRTLRAQVVREEPTCKLRLDGCTGLSETADHIIARSERPDLELVRSNLQGACHSCNYKRGNRAVEQVKRPAALAYFDV